MPSVYHSKGVTLFAPYSGADGLRDNNRYLFHVRANYGEETLQIVDHLITIGVRNMGLLYQRDPFGESGRDGVLKAMKAHNLYRRPSVKCRSHQGENAVRDLSSKRPVAVIMIT